MKHLIQPEKIAANNGIKIEYVIFDDDYKNIAGFFDFNEKKIYVNSEDNYNRRRFTIAHELAHFFLHQKLFQKEPQKYKPLIRKTLSDKHDPFEKEANDFAAQLLVPKKLLNKYVGYASIENLSKLFMVDHDLIKYSLRKTGRLF